MLLNRGPVFPENIFLYTCLKPIVLLYDAVEDEGVAPPRHPVGGRGQPGERRLIGAGQELVAIEQSGWDGEEGLVRPEVPHEHGQEARVRVRGAVRGQVLHQALHQRDPQAVFRRQVGLDHGLQLMRIPGECQVPPRPQHGHRDEALRLRGLSRLVDEQVGEEPPGAVVNGRVIVTTRITS